MTRRSFFAKTAGVLAFTAAAPFAKEMMPPWSAGEHLLRVTRAWRRDHPGQRPAYYIVSRALFERYAHELPAEWRFTHRALMQRGVPNIAFQQIPVMSAVTLRGGWVEMGQNLNELGIGL